MPETTAASGLSSPIWHVAAALVLALVAAMTGHDSGAATDRGDRPDLSAPGAEADRLCEAAEESRRLGPQWRPDAGPAPRRVRIAETLAAASRSPRPAAQDGFP